MYNPQAQSVLAMTGVLGVANGILAASVLIALGLGLIGLTYWRRGEWR